MSKGAKSLAFKVPVSKLAPAADDWIANRGAEPTSDREAGAVTALKPVAPAEAAAKEQTSRFTIDVPTSLHRRIKMQCAGRGQKMADVIRELLEREFPAA